VSVNVDDVEAAVAFYVERLGLARRGDRPDFGFGAHGSTPEASRCT